MSLRTKTEENLSKRKNLGTWGLGDLGTWGLGDFNGGGPGGCPPRSLSQFVSLQTNTEENFGYRVKNLLVPNLENFGYRVKNLLVPNLA